MCNGEVIGATTGLTYSSQNYGSHNTILDAGFLRYPHASYKATFGTEAIESMV